MAKEETPVKDEEVVVEEETPEEEEEVTEEEEQEEEESEEDPDELSEAEANEAKNLYKLLKGPNAAKVIQVLATQAGVLDPKDPPETKKEVKEAKKDIRALLKEKLGKYKMEWFEEALGPVLDEMMAEMRDSHESTASEIQAREVQNDVLKASKKLNKETNGNFDRLQKRMSQLANEFLPGPDVSVETYMRQLYTIASSERRQQKQSNQLTDKINRNASNVSERVRPSGGPQKNQKAEKASTGKMGLREAVLFAVDQQEKK